LGEVVSFDFREGSIFNWPAQSDSFFRKDIAGGGVLMDIGVHALDLLIWWLGEPKEFSCEDDAAGGVEANCCIKLKFEKGFEGSIRLSRDCLLANRYFIKCEKGWLGWNVGDANSIELGFHKTKFVLNGLVCNQMERYGLPSAGSVSPTYQQSFIYQLIDVIEAVKNRRKPFVCGEEGIRSLKLIEACYKNSKLMDMPWLSREEAEATMALRTKNNE
jgi:predicted dehydrogenase